MHHQTNPDDALAQAILALLIEDHALLWSFDELARAISRSTGPLDRVATEDAIETLHAAGLLHRVGDFVFATRAAHESQRLAS